jgi:hypothetical protein
MNHNLPQEDGWDGFGKDGHGDLGDDPLGKKGPKKK